MIAHQHKLLGTQEYRHAVHTTGMDKLKKQQSYRTPTIYLLLQLLLPFSLHRHFSLTDGDQALRLHRLRGLIDQQLPKAEVSKPRVTFNNNTHV